MQNLFETCSEGMREDICRFQRSMLQKLFSNHYNKVIIMIIDAFRTDFIPTIKFNDKFNLTMPFTECLLKNGTAISFVTRGFAPTVTLPRIKSLVTGTVSNFLDILFNFNAAELHDDNILKQASLSGLKSVFYGDDTWLKLFPNLFIRSEGTHSFFVSDFKEVDLNVSRHIKYEIINKDWNILILHFLGVDHIGHAYGPFSEHLSPKLIEMDKIIKFMYENIKSISPSPSLIIICGDHGMTVSGSHGGITEEELLTPLIFIDTANHGLNLNYTKTIDQVDFAPTLSILLGLPIPVNNFGSVIPDVLQFADFSAEKILYAEYYNFLQISHVYKNFFPLKTEHLDFSRKIIENHYKFHKENRNYAINNSEYVHLLKSYESLLTNMKKDLLGISTGYNEHLMMHGLLIMWVSAQLITNILLPLNLISKIIKVVIDKKFCIILLALTVLYIYFVNSFIIRVLLTISILLFIYQVSIFVFNNTTENSYIFMRNFCIVFLFIHAISLFSSSYIEEEHQTWYFFTCSLAILICYKRLNFYLKMCFISNSNLWIFWRKSFSTLYPTILILVLHRIFCKWNQVGNKWQHLPDISDWLNQKENVMSLGILLVFSQLILMIYFKNKLSKLCLVIFSSGLICTTLQKLNSAFFSYLNDYTKAMLIPWSVYMFSVLIIVLAFIQLKTNTYSSSDNTRTFILHFLAAWILLIEIIGRAHNIPLITVAIIQEYFLSKVLWIENCNIIFNALSYFIMGMSSFSYYGNSNSLSTIDVVTGYTGVQSYKPVVIAFLLTCNTFSTMVMWFTLIPYRILQLNILMHDFGNLVSRIKYIFLVLLNYKLLVLSLYSIVMFLMRHHLFIYSVFFPKLFFETWHVILISLICFFINFLHKKE